MRVRLWTAMFHEIGFVFWDTSYAKDGHKMSIWLGPEERNYVHVLQSVSAMLDSGVTMDKPKIEGAAADDVRGYMLKSGKAASLCLHHGACATCKKAGKDPMRPGYYTHERDEVLEVNVTLDWPKGHGYWIDPATGRIVGTFEAAGGTVTVKAPPFRVDVALLVTAEKPPEDKPLKE